MPCWPASPWWRFCFCRRCGRAPAAPPRMRCASPKPPARPTSPGPSPAKAARCWTAIPSIAAWPAWAKMKPPPPPELALAGEPSAAVLYRLSRDAAEGRAREESFVVVPGLEIVAAVRPLPDRQAAWWFTPRLAASTSPQPVLNRAAAAAPAPVVTAPEPAMPSPRRSPRISAICSATRPWAWPLPKPTAASPTPMRRWPTSSARPARWRAGISPNCWKPATAPRCSA